MPSLSINKTVMPFMLRANTQRPFVSASVCKPTYCFDIRLFACQRTSARAHNVAAETKRYKKTNETLKPLSVLAMRFSKYDLPL